MINSINTICDASVGIQCHVLCLDLGVNARHVPPSKLDERVGHGQNGRKSRVFANANEPSPRGIQRSCGIGVSLGFLDFR